MENPVVVIGSGMAAYFFAKEFRKVVVDRPLVMLTMTDGRFYSKPLLSTALTQQKSMDALSMMSAEAMQHSLNADIITQATVTAIDSASRSIAYKLEDGQQQSLVYSDLVMACGAEVLLPKLAGDAIVSLHSINQIEDYEHFRDAIADKKRIGILGAGFVGCEFANDLINGGYQATIIAPESYPLARLVPQPVGDTLHKAMTNAGVQWQLGRFAKAVDRRESGDEVTLDDGSTMSFDAVISAVGIAPKLDIARSAGVAIHQGIVIDAQCRTSDSHIFALGDCAEFDGQVRQYVAPLLQTARVLAKVMAGQNVKIAYPIMPVVVKTPACPIIVVSPGSATGQWLYARQEDGLSALFENAQGKLQGFALCGTAVEHKMGLMKRMQQD